MTHVQEVDQWSSEKKKGYGENESSWVSCSHYKKKGHDDEHCWKLHLEFKGKKKMDATTQQGHGSNSENEKQIVAMGMEDKTPSKDSSYTRKWEGEHVSTTSTQSLERKQLHKENPLA